MNKNEHEMTSFCFFTRLNQEELLGRKARNIHELLEGIKTVSGASIYYHTHRFLQQHHYLSPEPPNDFAYWITEVLQEDILGERLASVDIIQFNTIRELREKIVEIIENYLKSKRRTLRSCPEGEEFHFMSCRTFILPTNYVAENIEQFKEILKHISINSLYFHMFEARMRLGNPDNDFSRWFRDQGYNKIADAISRLDPYTYTLEKLRYKIISIIEQNG